MLTSPSGELLPSDLLVLVLAQLCLVRDIKGVKSTCKAFLAAAPEAEKAHRRVCFEHADRVVCVAAAPDGRVITGSTRQHRQGVARRRVRAHHPGAHSEVNAVAVLPGGARFVSVSDDGTAKLWTLDGALERTFEVGSDVLCVAALPDGAHFVVGLANKEVRLYHVDGTLVHTFKGHTLTSVAAVAVTPDGQHIISGSYDKLVKVWSVATKSLVSTCAGHIHCVHRGGGDARRPAHPQRLARQHRPRVAPQRHPREHLRAAHDYVNALVALPDNQHALSGSYDKTVKLFNVNDGAVLRTFTHHTDDR